MHRSALVMLGCGWIARRHATAARRLRMAPSHCVVFEDALVGVQAARAAGMRAVGVTTAHTEAELLAAGADRTIPDFQGLEWSSIALR